MTADVVFGAVFSMKVMDGPEEFGSVAEYAQCGLYRERYVVPFVFLMTLMGALVVLAIHSVLWCNLVWPHSSYGCYTQLAVERGEEIFQCCGGGFSGGSDVGGDASVRGI